MDLGDASSWLLVPLQILLVDLLLGADNALVIALACRSLPPKDVRRAATIGVLGAIGIRTLLALIATALLSLPLVKIVGALTLTVIAMNLATGHDHGEQRGAGGDPGRSLWSAAAIILVADTAMSLDNVVALAAIARGNIVWLAAGVAISLPIIAMGGLVLTEVLRRAPGLVEIGAALLGWIAFGMATTDPVLGGWVDVQAPALSALAPVLGAAFVFVYGRWAGALAYRPALAEMGAAWRQEPAPAPKQRRETEDRDGHATSSAETFAAPPIADDNAEPNDHHEAARTPASRDDRAAIIGVILLALAAGAMLMVVSFLDSVN